MCLHGLFDTREILLGIQNGFAPTSGFRVQPRDAFGLVMLEPVIDGNFATAQEASNLSGSARGTFEQDHLAAHAKSVCCAFAVAFFKCRTLCCREQNRFEFAHNSLV